MASGCTGLPRLKPLPGLRQRGPGIGRRDGTRQAGEARDRLAKCRHATRQQTPYSTQHPAAPAT